MGKLFGVLMSSAIISNEKFPKWFVLKMQTCARCQLRLMRRNVVIGRGEVPADIAFIGEAPGKTEDLLSEAFTGQSGKLLDKLISDSLKLAEIKKVPSVYFTNCVLCRPTDEAFGDNRQPSQIEVASCSSNVNRIIKYVKPKIVVFVGKIAEKYFKKEFPYTVSIQHPSFLLRQGGTASSYYSYNVRKLSEVYRWL
jgi:DNA polymerase